MMDRHIRRQIEEIIDAGEGEHRDVIVRMGRDQDRADPIVAAATEAIQRRSLTVSAREILPVESKAFLTPSGEAIPRRELRMLRAADSSVAAQVALGARQSKAVPIACRCARNKCPAASCDTVSSRSSRSRGRPASA